MRSLFISHGAPSLALDDSATGRFLDRFGPSLTSATALIVASAHDAAPWPTVGSQRDPDTIYDFGGFAPALRQIRYPAKGDPTLAQAAHARLAEAGFSPKLNPHHGLDHGVWVPLHRLLPTADIPLITLSIDPARSADYHYRLGAALGPLAEDGVLLIGSGGLVHNLGQLQWQSTDTPPDEWATQFAEWVHTRLDQGEVAELLAWETLAPHARRAHPTHEHLLPLFVAMGFAARPLRSERIHHATEMASLVLDAFKFD